MSDVLTAEEIAKALCEKRYELDGSCVSWSNAPQSSKDIIIRAFQFLIDSGAIKPGERKARYEVVRIVGSYDGLYWVVEDRQTTPAICCARCLLEEQARRIAAALNAQEAK